MPLSVTLTIAPKEDARAQAQQAAMVDRNLPDGCVLEDKTKKTDAKKKSGGEGEGFTDEPAVAQPRQGTATERVVEVELEFNDLKVNDAKNKTNNNTSQSSLPRLSRTLSLGSSKTSLTQDQDDFLEDDFYAMTIASTGKYSRKATLDDISKFAGTPVNSDVLKDWLKSYLQQNFPKQLEKPNCIPRTAHIQDDVKKGFDAFGTYGWKTIKLNLQPGLIDVKEQYTQEVTLEAFQLNYETDLEQALMKQGDKEVVNFLRKGPMKGHPLAVNVFKKSKKLQEDSQLITEFRGVDSTVFRLGNNECKAELEEETGDLVWKDVKKLRALLHGKPLPTKTGKGVSRTVNVLALESYLKARVYYKANFTGTVSTDHGNEQFDGRRYWNWDLKYLLRYNNIPNAQVMYQDIEVQFYSRIQYAMDNEDWIWINQGGSWVKQKVAANA